MGAQFAAGKRALGICDRCGFPYKLKKLREETVNDRRTNIKVCPDCFDPDHPQNQLGKYPVHDPQALRDPRPDNAELASSRANRVPVGSRNMQAYGRVGSVTVSTP